MYGKYTIYMDPMGNTWGHAMGPKLCQFFTAGTSAQKVTVFLGGNGES